MVSADTAQALTDTDREFELISDGAWRWSYWTINAPQSGVADATCADTRLNGRLRFQYRLYNNSLTVRNLYYRNDEGYNVNISPPTLNGNLLYYYWNSMSGNSNIDAYTERKVEPRVGTDGQMPVTVNFLEQKVNGSYVGATLTMSIGDERNYWCKVGVTAYLVNRVRDTTPGTSTTTSFDGSVTKVASFRALDRTSVTPGSPKCFKVAGRNSIPSGAHAVSVNVTAVNPTQNGWLVLYARGSTRPPTSNLNFKSGDIIGNAATVQVGSYNQICVHVSTTVTVIVDVMAYYPSMSHFRAVQPYRSFDKSIGAGTHCVDLGVLAAAEVASVNVAVVNPSNSGYFTIYPEGSSRPSTSNAYFEGNRVSSQQVMTGVRNGRACFYITRAARVVLDVSGYWYPIGSRPYVDTLDNSYKRLWSGWRSNATTKCYTVAGLPTGRPPYLAPPLADKVFLTATVDGAGSGYVTFYARGQTRPTTSNINFRSGMRVSNGALVDVGDYRQICAYMRGGGTLTIDLHNAVDDSIF